MPQKNPYSLVMVPWGHAEPRSCTAQCLETDPLPRFSLPCASHCAAQGSPEESTRHQKLILNAQESSPGPPEVSYKPGDEGVYLCTCGPFSLLAAQEMPLPRPKPHFICMAVSEWIDRHTE